MIDLNWNTHKPTEACSRSGGGGGTPPEDHAAEQLRQFSGHAGNSSSFPTTGSTYHSGTASIIANTASASMANSTPTSRTSDASNGRSNSTVRRRR